MRFRYLSHMPALEKLAQLPSGAVSNIHTQVPAFIYVQYRFLYLNA